MTHPDKPDLRVVPDPDPDPMLKGFLSAVSRDQEYESGERQIDSAWISGLLEDPKLGQPLEELLRGSVGAGRRAPEQQDEVEEEIGAIIASIKSPGEVELTQDLARKRSHFLRLLDGMNPERYNDENVT